MNTMCHRNPTKLTRAAGTGQPCQHSPHLIFWGTKNGWSETKYLACKAAVKLPVRLGKVVSPTQVSAGV